MSGNVVYWAFWRSQNWVIWTCKIWKQKQAANYYRKGSWPNKRKLSGSALFFCLTLCPVGTYFGRTFGHSCRTLSDVRRLFPGLTDWNNLMAPFFPMKKIYQPPFYSSEKNIFFSSKKSPRPLFSFQGRVQNLLAHNLGIRMGAKSFSEKKRRGKHFSWRKKWQGHLIRNLLETRRRG